MQETRRISIELNGKKYAITTTQQEDLVLEAAAKLEQALQKLAKQAPTMREDQRILFSALSVAVDATEERRAVQAGIAQCESAIETVLGGN